MKQLIFDLFGEGQDLNTLQMGSRAFVMFFITLFFIRLSGMRAFGIKSAFDNIIIILLGAVLSRAVVGASPFVPVVTAGLVMVIIHRLLAHLTVTNKTLSHLIKGKPVTLYKDGHLNTRNMNRCNISTGDLMEGIRNNGNIDSLDKAEQIVMERSGHISVIKKEQK